MKKIVILTGGELRHTFFRMALALIPGITVLRSYCEGTEQSLEARFASAGDNNTLCHRHIVARARSEEDFFGSLVSFAPDRSNPNYLPKGAINQESIVEEIIAIEPDLLVAYGCSLIKKPLIMHFKKRFLNVHLGLSPYYRGSGTNFWPLVNGEPEYVGATFMYIDEGIDTGEIIHQIRPTVYENDGPHSIGNRLIVDMTKIYGKLVCQFNELEALEQMNCANSKVYKNGDFCEQAVAELYKNFENGMIADYIKNIELKYRQAPILTQP